MELGKPTIRMSVLITPEMHRSLKKKRHEGLTMAWYIRMAIEKILAADEGVPKRKRSSAKEAG